ncbi:ShlB/FhaC/HecB family hemolysin secretion/activation protein, partial [Metapseudomonas otitidis]
MRTQPFAVGFCLLLFPVFQVFAADPVVPSPGDRDLIRDRQERLLEEQRKRLQELQQLPGRAEPVAPSPPQAQGPCFDIQRIRLQGVHLISEVRQRELLKPFEHQCLDSGRLNDLLKAITQHYIDRGYVTSRAYLPQQDLADGELDVIVVEGRLEGVEG